MSVEQRSLSKARPVNLNLMTIRFPIAAIVSILHRITGVILFLFVPFLIWLFALSLSSSDNFVAVEGYLQMPVIKFLVWLFLAGLSYHMLAGIRHLIMDIGIGETLSGGRWGSRVVILLAIVMAVILGVWLW